MMVIMMMIVMMMMTMMMFSAEACSSVGAYHKNPPRVNIRPRRAAFSSRSRRGTETEEHTLEDRILRGGRGPPCARSCFGLAEAEWPLRR